MNGNNENFTGNRFVRYFIYSELMLAITWDLYPPR